MKIAPDLVLGQGAASLPRPPRRAFSPPRRSCDWSRTATAATATRRTTGCGPGPQRCRFCRALTGNCMRAPIWTRPIGDRASGSPGGMAAAMAALAERQIDVCLEIGQGDRLVCPAERESATVPPDDGRSVDGRWRPSMPPARIFPGSGWHPAPGVACACPRIPGNGSGCGRRARTASRDRHSAADGCSRAIARFGRRAGRAAEVRVRPDLTAPYVAPRTQLETEMAGIVVGHPAHRGIGIHDNFFELGGDSLQATILLNRLEETLGEGGAGPRALPGADDQTTWRTTCGNIVPTRSGGDTPTKRSRRTSGEPAGAACRSRKPPRIRRRRCSIPRLARDRQAEDLLARLDELSDEEVELLLGQAAGDGEADHE